MECPAGTLAYGLTLFLPNDAYWRDPDLGPPPITTEAIPISVCLLCGRVKQILREGGSGEFETLTPLPEENPNLSSYQVCIGKGKNLP